MPSLPPLVAFSDGTWRVPDDVEPGTYRTVEFTTDCYWTRLRGFDSGLRDLIASNVGSGYQLVAIGPRDAGFDSVNCGEWTADLRPVTGSPTEFGEGTYRVGTDLLPGTYRASQGESCAWLRLSGFGFTRLDILERGFGKAGDPPMVEIRATDAGFSASGCGTWTKV